LLYDIEPDVATELYGDYKRVEQVLRIFLTDISTTVLNSVISLKVSCVGDKTKRLQVSLHTNDKIMLEEEIESLFSSYSLGESYKSKEKLDVYVASELVKKMGGSLDVISNEKDGTTYNIELPYQVKNISQTYKVESYNKRLLIIEDIANVSHAITKIFQQYIVHIDTYTSKKLDAQVPNFYNYDMVVVNTKLLSSKILDMLEKVRVENECFVVQLYNNFDYVYKDMSTNLIDISLQKPLQHEQVQTMFARMKDQEKVPIKINTFNTLENTEGVTRENFSQFSHVYALIVEDNPMNQKILNGVLKDSA